MKKDQLTTTIYSSTEIQLHYKRPLFIKMKHINSAEKAQEVIKEFADSQRIDLKEFFWVLLLSNANRLLGISEIASGSSRGVVINIKEILQLALMTSSSAIILAHNHPSGNLSISSSDKRLTEKLKQVTDVMEITLLDHIIISSESFTSFVKEGLL